MKKNMIKQCCDASGKPDYEHIKEFMEQCGKTEFTDEDIKRMKDCCAQRGQLDPEQIKQCLQKCGYLVAKDL
ncbi:MAG: hypothetical protein V7731_17515 [Amphritea sp.]